MDSWEFNKIAAAVLAALLIAFGGSTVIGLTHGEHGGAEASHEKAGYTLPVDVAASSAGGHAEKKKEFDFSAVIVKLQTASADAGANVFKKCKTCHTSNEGGKNAVGPNLWGIVGREKGSHEGFNYSKSMKEKGGKWSFEDLAHFVHDPKSFITGTKMSFAGLKDPDDLANVLAYLRSLSSNPAPLPKPAAAEKPAPTQAAGGEKPSQPATPPAEGAKKPAQPAAPAAGETKPKAN
jgi:cytochrome c